MPSVHSRAVGIFWNFAGLPNHLKNPELTWPSPDVDLISCHCSSTYARSMLQTGTRTYVSSTNIFIIHHEFSHLANLVVFCKSVKIKNRKYQSFPHNIPVRNLSNKSPWGWSYIKYWSEPTVNLKVSLKTGFRVFRWIFVSNFFFLSGRRKTLTYGSEVPQMSMAARSW